MDSSGRECNSAGMKGNRRFRRRAKSERAAQNQFRGLQKTRRAKVRLLPQGFIIVIIDQDGAASGGVAAINVTPAIANHPARAQVDVEFARGPQQQAWFGFPAIAFRIVEARMITNLDAIERQARTHVTVDLL